ncbi:MAG: phytanoyl-CoA dioxygenase family protein [Armatimonadetes bacterium]|nr:phytanoyl-CoA dioxygenase family protein [Armatimonadota bacterium]MBX3110101.1 phytanoyl-CoA dioxygenase family protein [Fimbriimonadaceae bacterium]
MTSGEQAQAYARDGHALVRGVLSGDELAEFRNAVRETAARLNREQRPLAERDTYGQAFLQTTNLWRHSVTVARYILSPAIGKIAAELMGVRGVRLYHDQSLFKEPGGGPTPWHQDQQYWPLDTPNTVTMWMPLVDAGDDMGTMMFASGSHGLGYLGNLPISDKSDETIRDLIRERGFEVTPPNNMRAGDATFHSGWVFHGAPGNRSSQMREVMTAIYFEDGAKVGQADSQDRQNDLASWFPGLAPGDLAATELNPLVYSA